jgi:hypothetical protein
LTGPGTEYQGIKWQTKTSGVAIARSGDIVITHGYTFTVSRLYDSVNRTDELWIAAAP